MHFYYFQGYISVLDKVRMGKATAIFICFSNFAEIRG